MLPGQPIRFSLEASLPQSNVVGYESAKGIAFERLGLVVPTSLCAGQVARMAVDLLNEKKEAENTGVDRYVTLVHTEGCGASSGSSEELYMKTMFGHIIHPNINQVLLLEHGCEKTHNDYFRSYLEAEGINADRLGWASIQRDGGIHNAIQNIQEWFLDVDNLGEFKESRFNHLNHIKLGLLLDGQDDEKMTHELALLISGIVKAGGSVVIPQVMAEAHALLGAIGVNKREPNIAYAQVVKQSGLFLMDTPSWNWQELITGLGATSVNLILYAGEDTSRPGHPFIPTIQVSRTSKKYADLHANEHFLEEINSLILRIVTGEYTPIRQQTGNADFQITRGLYGISL